MTGPYRYRDWTICPVMVAALERYVTQGVRPGRFLQAVISNDLKEAVGRADGTNLANLPAFIGYLYNEAPATSWGSAAVMEAWLAQPFDFRPETAASLADLAAPGDADGPLTRKLIRASGAEEPFSIVPGLTVLASARHHIGAEGCDVVRLRHLGTPDWVMLVDDTGFIDHKPINAKATALYHANCKPGTTHPICGDVVIVPDDDFA